MLKTRIVTAVVLLALLAGVLWVRSYPLFVAVACVFFAAASWEAGRLFGVRRPEFGAGVWMAVLAYFAFQFNAFNSVNALLLFALCAAIWVVRLAPSLAISLPPLGGARNRLLGGIYEVALFGCFAGIIIAYRQSILFLFSCMAIVWIADIGAYFAGKAWGKHKLAPTISPGKSWEGAIGGWLCVLLIAGVSASQSWMIGSFPERLLVKAGWAGGAAVLSVIVAASVVGDLFESQLKRRRDVKDSSNLLPGHGGVLDRIDALIPAMPLMLLAGIWL